MSDSAPLQPPDNHATLLSVLKDRIRAARVQAALAVNRELILLYWSIGRDILARMSAEGCIPAGNPVTSPPPLGMVI